VRRKRRVRVHLADPHPQVDLPTVEGILVSKLFDEYVIAVPSLVLAANAPLAELADAKELRIPRARVAFYEVLR
jgi:hypothetical protein